MATWEHMGTRGDGSRRVWRMMVPLFFALVAAMLAGMLLAAVPTARARAYDTSGFSMSIVVTDATHNPNPVTTFTYDAPYAPAIRGTMITPPPPNSGLNSANLHIVVDGTMSYGSSFIGNSSDPTHYSIYLPLDWSEIGPGTHTVVATYYDFDSKTTIQSNTVSFTINKAATELMCDIQNLGYVYSPGESLQIAMQVTSNGGIGNVDWQHATYTISFTGGPAPRTDANVAPDSNDWVTVPAPSQVGYYQMGCTFNGTDSFAATTSVTTPVTISSKHALGSVRIYTNPTTYSPYQACDMYIVFHAAPGGPTPTGLINITMGRNTTGTLTLGPDGTLMVHLSALPNPSEANNQIVLDYHGDSYYNSGGPTFSYTNPPIPGSGSTGGGGNGNAGGGASGQATATATPKSTATPTATATLTATETPTDASTINAVSSGAGDSGINPLVWLAIAVVLLGLGGGGAGVVISRARRAKAPLSGDGEVPPFNPTALGG